MSRCKNDYECSTLHASNTSQYFELIKYIYSPPMFERSSQVPTPQVIINIDEFPSLSSSTSQPIPKLHFPKHTHVLNGMKTIISIDIDLLLEYL